MSDERAEHRAAVVADLRAFAERVAARQTIAVAVVTIHADGRATTMLWGDDDITTRDLLRAVDGLRVDAVALVEGDR